MNKHLSKQTIILFKDWKTHLQTGESSIATTPYYVWSSGVLHEMEQLNGNVIQKLNYFLQQRYLTQVWFIFLKIKLNMEI